jgi:hypothetical protein
MKKMSKITHSIDLLGSYFRIILSLLDQNIVVRSACAKVTLRHFKALNVFFARGAHQVPVYTIRVGTLQNSPHSKEHSHSE